jgi:hypothetical protein
MHSDRQFENIEDLKGTIADQKAAFIRNADSTGNPLEVIEQAATILLDHLESRKADSPSDVTVVLKELADAADEYEDTEIAQLAKDFQAGEKERRGLIVEVAAAASTTVSDNNVESAKWHQLGAWATLLYSTSVIDAIAVARYRRDFDVDENIADIGLRLRMKAGRFAASFESLVRVQKSIESSYRYALNLEYEVADGMYFVGAFGKDFEGNPIVPEGDLIAILGLNIGLGKNPVITLP